MSCLECEQEHFCIKQLQLICKIFVDSFSDSLIKKTSVRTLTADSSSSIFNKHQWLPVAGGPDLIGYHLFVFPVCRIMDEATHLLSVASAASGFSQFSSWSWSTLQEEQQNQSWLFECKKKKRFENSHWFLYVSGYPPGGSPGGNWWEMKVKVIILRRCRSFLYLCSILCLFFVEHLWFISWEKETWTAVKQWAVNNCKIVFSAGKSVFLK